MQIGIDGVNGLLAAVHVGTDALDVFQFLLYLSLVGTQSLLLFLYVLLDACLLVTESADGTCRYVALRTVLLRAALFCFV